MLSEPHRSWRDAQNFLVTWWCSEAGNVGTAKVTIVYHLPCIRVKGALVTVTWTQRQRQAHTGIKYGHLTCIRIAYCYNKPDFGGGGADRLLYIYRRPESEGCWLWHWLWPLQGQELSHLS